MPIESHYHLSRQSIPHSYTPITVPGRDQVGLGCALCKSGDFGIGAVVGVAEAGEECTGFDVPM